MSVTNKGWRGGNGSMADAMFEKLWGIGDQRPMSTDNITEGPLAQFPEDYDPVAWQREKTAEFVADFKTKMATKTAASIGTNNNPDSSTTPGGNRSIQQDVSGMGTAVVQQSPEDARQNPGVPTAKKDTAPSKGSKGSELMARIRAKRAEKGEVTSEETTTKSVPQTQEEVKHNLQVKAPAPVPKELNPRMRVGNLAAGHEQSAWTGSGPQAALHDDYSKVGELLDLAGVPPCELYEDSILRLMAESALTMVKEAGSYLARNDVHPLKLVAELEDTLGADWSEWEPETIRESIVKEAGVDPSDDVMSKIMAVKIIMRRPEAFFDDWQSMEKISVALNDRSPMMGAIEDVPIEWLSNAVSIVGRLVGPADFGPEVSKYAAARLYDQGYVVAPPLLKFADVELGQMVGDDDLRKKVILAYAKSLNATELGEGEDEVSIQVARLLRNNAYVLDRLDESRGQLE